MRAMRASVVKCLACTLVALALSSATACAEGSALGGPGVSPLESPLVVPGSPVEGEQVRAQGQAISASPEAVATREASQTMYEGLGTAEAAKLAGEKFPVLIDEPAGGPPKLVAGQSIAGYSADNVAQIDLGEGRRGVVESTGPIATESSPGRWVPIDLSVSEVGSAFHIANPAVGVSIPKRLQDGVSLADSGVSLTPVANASGAAVTAAEGRVDGSVVFYGGVSAGSNVDELVKPETGGFSEDAILRSAASPKQLFYHVGLPEGASLVRADDGSGSVNVVDQGSVIASVLAPHAQDAAGTPVGVSLSILTGDVLELTVDRSSGEYLLPIEVDPTVTDNEISFEPGNWAFHTTDSEVFYPSPKSGKKLTELKDSNEYENFKYREYPAGKTGYFQYQTQGSSEIYAFTATFEENNTPSTSYIANRVALRKSNGEKEFGNGENAYAEKTEPITHGKEVLFSKVKICRNDNCTQQGLSSTNNFAIFQQESVEAGKGLFQSFLREAAVQIEQEAAPSASFDTTDSTIEGLPNALLSGSWHNAKASLEFGLNASDKGIGINKEGLSSPSKAGWGYALKKETRNECQGVQCNQCYEPACAGKASGNGKPLSYALGSAEGGELPEGEDTVEGKVEDAVGLSATPKATIKIDNAPPHNITLSGLPSNHETVDGQHLSLKASATDGTEGTRSSGIASILLEVDGQSVSGPQGSCSPGSCTGNAEWALSGENYAAGEHALTVVATDNAGNVATEEYHLKIHHPEDVAVGPGSVNPVTGELRLGATDVSLGVPGGGLTVSRSYRSWHVAQGTEGPLGPQWIMSLGSQQSLSRVSGGMVLTGSSAGQIIFESKGKGEFTSPTGDASLTLLEKTVESKTMFTLSQNGSVTTFELPSGSSGSVWMPSSTEGPNGTNATLYKFKLENGVIEPTEELAPIPAGVSCGKAISELKEGCRALKFEYATETKAKGEKASEWGSFKGHLAEVKYIAWNASKTKTEPVVAEYAYDVKGRLRAEWNPEIKPSPLKTTYGYDAEGHVSAISTAGHEPALLEQGTISSDASPGRLLAVAVPSAATALGSGEAPVNEAVPTLSSTKPAVGTKISVNLTNQKTPGQWSHSPLAFIYQWEDCNGSGKECAPIPGAVNQAYYPVSGDEGHTLVAQAIALNATGATTASSTATSTVANGTPNTPLPEPPTVGSDAVTTLEYQVPVSGSGAPYEMSSTEVAKWGQTDDPNEAMAVFPPDKVMGWPAKEYKRETVYYLDGKDRAVNTASPTGGISTGEYNSYNDVVRTLSPDNRQKSMNEGCKKLKEECKSEEVSKLLDTQSSYEEKGSEPGTELLSTLGPQHTVKLAVGKEGKTNEEVLARAQTSFFYNEGAPSEGGPYHLATKTVEGAETASKEEFDKRTTETSYSGQNGLGWKLRKPTSITTDPGGLKLLHTTEYNASTGAVIQTKTPAASGKDTSVPPAYSSAFGSLGSGDGQLHNPIGDATDSSGNVWVTDADNQRIEKFSPSGTFMLAVGWGVKDGKTEAETCTTGCRAGIAGSGKGQFENPWAIAINQTTGNVYVSDYSNDRVEELSSSGAFIAVIGSAGSGEGQLLGPTGTAIDSSGNVWVADNGNYRVEEFSSSGTYKAVYGKKGAGNGEFNAPYEIAFSGGHLYVTDTSNNRVQELSTSGTYLGQFGTKGTGNGQFNSPMGITTNPSNGNLYVIDNGNYRVEEFSPSGVYLMQFGTQGSGNGQFSAPKGIAVDSSGNLYVVDSNTNERVQKWTRSITGNEGAHDTKTIYYTTAANSEYTSCGEHPAMANLPCETTPAAQPGTSGLPELATTKYTYNIWNEPETTTETVGSTTRTKTDTYDETGRLKTAGISSTVGETLPIVTNEYNKETGALEKQCTNEGKPCTEGKPKTITSVYNKLGQLETYTDAGEITSTYEYDVDGRVKKVNDGKGTESYAYSETTGLITELVYENGTTKLPFTGTYDAEGNMLTESYPNTMTATYTYDQVGKPTALEYKKTAHCKSTCPETWFSDSVIPSIHNQWLEQTSTLSHLAYTYDNAGRLTQAQNTPTGKGCTTRIYTYDENTNRTSLTTREPGTEGKCTSTGGKVQIHTYDTADRLTDSGVTYNTFGNITTLPANDAEESAEHELTNTYYTDNQVASQKQNEQTVGYNLDPAGRTLETVSSGKPNNSTIISHYAGLSNTPAWTLNPLSSEWRRNITGINGSLVAIQNNGETPELQLTNLHGDIIAKAYLSETATELAAKADTSEYGVPLVSAPAKYSWLGAIQLPTELPSGVISMGARSYVPQIGRFLQPDPIPGGSANAYSYTFGDPVNSTDPTGAYAATASTVLAAVLGHEAEAAAAAREAAARAAAEAAARAAAAAAATAGPQYAGEEEWGEEEWEEWWEEEGGYEYASYQHGAKQESDYEEAQIEPALLVQPLGEGEGQVKGEGTTAVPLCKHKSELRSCSRDVWFAEYLIKKVFHAGEHFIFSDSLKFASKIGQYGLDLLHASTAVTAAKLLFHCVRQDTTACDPLGNWLGIENAS